MCVDGTEVSTRSISTSLWYDLATNLRFPFLAEATFSPDPIDPFAAALDETRTPIVITNPRLPDNPIVFVNKAFSRLTGYPAHEIAGRNGRMFQGPETSSMAVAAIRNAVERGEQVETDIRNYRKDGSSFWNRIRIAPVRDATGRIAYFFSNHTVIDAAWGAPSARTQEPAGTMADAARLLEQRTQDLQEITRRYHAEVKAREQVEATLQHLQKIGTIGQLTGGIAHDFNNLLGSISGSLELLQRSIRRDQADVLERYAAMAIDSARRAASLTQRLLALVRQEPRLPERTDVNRFLADMEDLLRRTLGPSIELEMLLPDGLPHSVCDPNLLDSAILNLAINARDAMPDGGRLTIATAHTRFASDIGLTDEAQIKAGHYVTISVTDTGVGMSKTVAARAFEPFFTTKPAGEGTGLGLAMVYGFTKQSAGHVRIHSVPGRGTTLELHLPAYPDPLPVEPPTPLPIAEVASPPPRIATILVVDDEDTFRTIIDETLQALGYTTLEATNGKSALNLLRGGARIDLLVTDIGLPGIDGRRLAEAARSIRPELPVLFMTGYLDDSTSTGIIGGRHTRLLNKPFSLPAFERTVRAMLDTSDAAPSPSRAGAPAVMDR